MIAENLTLNVIYADDMILEERDRELKIKRTWPADEQARITPHKYNRLNT